VHAYTWQGLPSTRAFTRRTLAFQVLLERLWEWDTLIPKLTPFPQKSHFAIVAPPLFFQKVNVRIISNLNEKSKYLSAFFPNYFDFFIIKVNLFLFNKKLTFFNKKTDRFRLVIIAGFLYNIYLSNYI
jgi:hypothetical protein